jgi:hypothetical protein
VTEYKTHWVGDQKGYTLCGIAALSHIKISNSEDEVMCKRCQLLDEIREVQQMKVAGSADAERIGQGLPSWCEDS